MTAPRPLISVIVPVHDVAGHVEAAIASLRAQTLTDFEAIVVDDGATDGSGDLAAAAAGGDARFRLIRQSNRGLSGARNTGLEAATGAFIAFLDGDDRLAPEYLERLHGVLAATGADWVACAIRNVHPDGSSDVHSAIHGAPEPGTARRYPLTDWRAVIRHFPSAWNKLYRRGLIEGLRFDEGTWFEDHAFYYRAAARTDHLEHLPEPLYLQTRGRPGQITTADSERVFEQLSVLETLSTIMAASDKAGAHGAFERIATRLTYERSTVLRNPDRRARFAAASRALFAHHGLRWRPGWDPGIARSWGLVMDGELPLSVIIPSDGTEAQLATTLDALARQSMPDFEVLVVTDPDRPALSLPATPAARVLTQPGRGAGSARNRGRAAARGRFVVFLDAGDVPYPETLERWCNAMLRLRADFGFSGFRIGIDGANTHGGMHDMSPADEAGPDPGRRVTLTPRDALALHAHPSAKIFRRAFLEARDIRFGAGLLPEWDAALHAALMAQRAVRFASADIGVSEDPAARRLWRAPARARDLAAAIDRIAARPGTGALAPGWQARLFARAVWEKAHFADHRPGGAAWLLLTAALLARWRGWVGGDPDPYIGRRLRRLLGVG